MKALLAILILAPGIAMAECRLALSLALDVSSSVNAAEYEIQKGGLANALRDPEIRAAALSPPGSVYLATYEWSGWQQQDLVIAWTRLDDEAAIDAFADKLDRHRRTYAEFSTALGHAVDYGAQYFAYLPEPCAEHVIDVSGDGVNNDGFGPDGLWDSPLLARVTVNGLVIKGAEPDPEPYYRTRVIWGPGSFLMVARNGFDDYAEMIKGKLLRELEPNMLLGERR